MPTKSFKRYLEKRLTPQAIAEVEKQAADEYNALRSLQQEISAALTAYVTQEKIGFNELVRRLGISATQVIKIQKGNANVTLATLAHISALLKRRPHLIFK